ncbi:MAG: peptidylprolyl isomerase [Gammaproteobacteria bacterium]|nr:peptidylprolyl isomerase [Gammaproteobacteria bacterium]
MKFIQQSFLLLILVFMQGLFAAQAGAHGGANTKPEVVFETSKGSFTIELYPDKAPLTVANFLGYVDEGFYDNTIFHRVVPDFVIQGGGFESGMKAKETREPVKNESSNRLKNIRGSVSVARRTHPDTGTSQFYINLVHNSRLDYKGKVQPGYTVFGRISKGMDVIDKMSVVETTEAGGGRNVPKEDIVLISAKRKVPAEAVKEDKTAGTSEQKVDATEPEAEAVKEDKTAGTAEQKVDATEPVADVVEQKADASADKQQEYVAGEHYVVLDEPVATRDSSKIEVVEMFSYGCPHCYEFEPMVKQWGAQQGGDVDFWYFPAVWSKGMKLYARAFYAAYALDVLDRIHLPLFKAIAVEQRNIRNEADLAEFFAGYGVTEGAFNEAFNLAAVQEKVSKDEDRVRNYKPVGVPEIVVNGKYRIDRMHAGGYEGMLKVADFLIDKERAALKQ